jgi:uncharacterized membrane protein YraQ (UPF0718 family)
MAFIMVFFKDILNGPVYIVVCVVCGILICSCIGYLAEKSIRRKKEAAKYVKVEQGATPQPTPSVAPTVTTPPVQPAVATMRPETPQPTPPTPPVAPQPTNQPVPTQNNTPQS